MPPKRRGARKQQKAVAAQALPEGETPHSAQHATPIQRTGGLLGQKDMTVVIHSVKDYDDLTGGATRAHTSMSDDDLDKRILLAFYQQEEPQSATPEKVGKVIRSFQRKAEKAGGGDWRESMYAAFAVQRGLDPRVYWESIHRQPTAAPGPAPAPDHAAARRARWHGTQQLQHHQRQTRGQVFAESRPMQIFVKTHRAKTITLDVHHEWSVSMLQAAIEDREGVPANMQRLVYRGKQIDASRSQLTLADFEIQKESTLHLHVTHYPNTAPQQGTRQPPNQALADAPADKISLFGGSWRKSARGATVTESGLLTAELRKRDGSWAQAQLQYIEGAEHENIDGIFTLTQHHRRHRQQQPGRQLELAAAADDVTAWKTAVAAQQQELVHQHAMTRTQSHMPRRHRPPHDQRLILAAQSHVPWEHQPSQQPQQRQWWRQQEQQRQMQQRQQMQRHHHSQSQHQRLQPLARLANNRQWAALIAACVAGRDPNDPQEFATGSNGPSSPPLLTAAREGAPEEVIDALVTARADIGWQDPNCRLTALHQSANGGHVPATRALIRLGAPIDLRADGVCSPSGNCAKMGFLGGTPLHFAASMNRTKTAKMLLKMGADATLRNMEGQTPLELAEAPCRLEERLAAGRGSKTEVAACIRTTLEAQRLCGALQRLALAMVFSADGARLVDALAHDMVLTISEALRPPTVVLAARARQGWWPELPRLSATAWRRNRNRNRLQLWLLFVAVHRNRRNRLEPEPEPEPEPEEQGLQKTTLVHRVGDVVQVFSKGADRWLDGRVVTVTDACHVTVEYYKLSGAQMRKTMPADSADLLSVATPIQRRGEQLAIQRRAASQTRDADAGVTAIRITGSFSHSGAREAAGYYVHCPETFNRDIYRLQEDVAAGKMDGAYLYWYVPRGNRPRGNWRTSCGMSTPGGCADPSSSRLGGGSQYPLYQIPVDEKYQSQTQTNGWNDTYTVEFIRAERPATAAPTSRVSGPEMAALMRAAISGQTQGSSGAPKSPRARKSQGEIVLGLPKNQDGRPKPAAPWIAAAVYCARLLTLPRLLQIWDRSC